MPSAGQLSPPFCTNLSMDSLPGAASMVNTHQSLHRAIDFKEIINSRPQATTVVSI